MELVLGVFAALLGTLALLRDVLDWKLPRKRRVIERDERAPAPVPMAAPAGHDRPLGSGGVWVALTMQALLVLFTVDVALGLGSFSVTIPGGSPSAAGGLWSLAVLLLVMSLAYGATGLYVRSKDMLVGPISDRARLYVWSGGIGLAAAALLLILRGGDMF
ncbi:hypothetical protein HTZ77_10475 [Nonomuraea sp. SMC257]|uniref:Uncharacterized protein n=1 Tax=Nonomuraea montanisoli TaxID=2741721 RepID=A0A7Y6M344_9ACTN|nr:hypothetical protein [Nonomuraea montanisoli]NUW31849.1 hypothetical protein [Nonomuraea montanisoli]